MNSNIVTCTQSVIQIERIKISEKQDLKKRTAHVLLPRKLLRVISSKGGQEGLQQRERDPAH